MFFVYKAVVRLIGVPGLVLLLTLGTAMAETYSAEMVKVFPARIGGFRQVVSVHSLKSLSDQGMLKPEIVGAEFSGGEAVYESAKGERVLLELVLLKSDADAYSFLTVIAHAAKGSNRGEVLGYDVGTASLKTSGQISFFKGPIFVRVSSNDSNAMLEFAHLMADQLDKGEADIPALVKHLPDVANAQKKAVFLSRFRSLEALEPEQQVLSAINAEGDADAVISDYGSARVLIVEFHTPQLATDNDQRIIAKIHELWKLGQPAPSAYRRVGNYSVFVFGAPDEQTAKQLVDQVKYEQVVQWLGENPYILKEAQRRYAETTLGVFVAVVKASGFALIGCVAMGGLLGALLFNRRRAQQRSVEAFSDAGGMLRLNIDELTPQTDPARLLRERN